MRVFEKRGKWWIDLREPGTGRRVRKPVGTKRQAELALAKVRTEIFEGTYFAEKQRRDGLTMAGLRSQWLEHAADKKSIKEDKQRLQRAIEFFGGQLPVARIEPEQLDAYREWPPRSRERFPSIPREPRGGGSGRGGADRNAPPASSQPKGGAVMSVVLRKGDDAIRRRVLQIAERFHTDLHDGGVTFAVLWAEPVRSKDGEALASTLKHRGIPAEATVRIVPTRDRALGMADAQVTIDEFTWDQLSEAERDALIDHELTHLEVIFDPEHPGEPKEDHCGRPKLRMRKHDVEVGWFYEVAERHGAAAAECRGAKSIFSTEEGQLFLAGMETAAAVAVNGGAGNALARLRTKAAKRKLAVVDQDGGAS